MVSEVGHDSEYDNAEPELKNRVAPDSRTLLIQFVSDVESLINVYRLLLNGVDPEIVTGIVNGYFAGPVIHDEIQGKGLNERQQQNDGQDGRGSNPAGMRSRPLGWRLGSFAVASEKTDKSANNLLTVGVCFEFLCAARKRIPNISRGSALSLAALIHHAGYGVTNEYLRRLIGSGSDDVIKVHVSRLRQALRKVGVHVEIVSIGRGYGLTRAHAELLTSALLLPPILPAED